MIKIQDDMREKAILQTKLNDKKTDEMFKIEEKLREKCISVNDFIRECELKYISSEKKIQTEQQLHETLQSEIDKFEKELSELTEFKETLSSTVEDFKQYENVMEKIVSESDLYKSVKDLMDRCDALMLAQVEISEMEQSKIKSIEEMKQEMVNATNDAAMTIMGLNNELAELERGYNIAQAENLKWEKILSETKNYISDNKLKSIRLIDSIHGLYNMLIKRNGEKKVISPENYEEILDYIKEELQILQEIVRLSSAKIAKGQKSIQVEKGSAKKSK